MNGGASSYRQDYSWVGGGGQISIFTPLPTSPVAK